MKSSPRNFLPECYGRSFVRVDSTFDLDLESKELTEKVSELTDCILTGEALLAFCFYLDEKQGFVGANISLFRK